jgi:2-polyprenyl-6-methoxyphenol hydroxylase-like FAD-dependent oxidoreductase
VKVLVVGAGPAGTTTALLLARFGVEVRLVEREASFERTFRGEGLMPLGIDALLEMGLGGVLEAVPGRTVESWGIWIDGEEVFVIPEPVEELGERAMRVVSQPCLLEKLVEEASRYPSFSFERGARVQDLLRDRDGRVVGAALKRDERTEEARADLVIGCDGRGSLVRKRAGLGLEMSPEQYDVLWFKVPAPERLREGCSITIAVAAKEHPAICYTSWDGRLQYGLVMPKGGLKEMREEDWVGKAVRPVPSWLAEHIVSHQDEIEGPIRLNVLVGRAPRWTVPGLLLLGDAAHPMSPVRAQGSNLALRDAVVAANHLVPALRGGRRGERGGRRVPSRAGRARARDRARPEAPAPGGRRAGGRPLGELALRVDQAPGPPDGTLPVGAGRLARTTARPALRLEGGQAQDSCLIDVRRMAGCPRSG